MVNGGRHTARRSSSLPRQGRTRGLTAVILDEYPLWLETMARVLESVGVENVGSTSEPDEAISLVKEHQPRLFVLGLERTPAKRHQAAALFEAASRIEGMSTIVVSSDNDSEFIDYCLAHGTTAYVLKTIRADDLSSTIRQALDRCVYLFGTPKRKHNGELHKLTPREYEVLLQVADGLSNAEVAQRLWISVATVKFHLTKTYEKLGVANRTGAVRWAQRQGLLGVDGSAVAHPQRSETGSLRRPAARGSHSLSRS
jgi:two-component system, NarL family, nitrate/nitrite response regulator NarL